MTTRKCLTALLVISICCHVCAGNAHAAWSSDPSVNTAICTAVGDQQNFTMISDGSGGAIISWDDYRNGSNYHIYAQRIDADGVVQWTTDGVAICSAAGDQVGSTMISDGGGGAIITWFDFRSGNFDIYAQRINAGGVVQWTTDGVAVCAATGHQTGSTIISDGSGGAIISWADTRSGSNSGIYAQRINAGGVVQWTTDGVAICTAAGERFNPLITSDGSDGAIITWMDFRNDSETSDIYAQRINAGGVVQWATDGVAICTAAGEQSNPFITSDGSGGAIITWEDFRSGSNYHIYAQRINAGGVVQWTTDGEAICSAAVDQHSPALICDGSGGAIITWFDFRSGNFDIYAQRINAGGLLQWVTDGVAICKAAGDQYGTALISDGSGGAIISWDDYRNGSNSDIYAQRINAGGVVQWASEGVAICTAAGDQFSNYGSLISDGSGGAIITWEDRRGSDKDIYAQWIDAGGTYLLVKGDVNGDGQVDLADAILCLQVLSGLTPDHIYSTVDVDGDGKIGMAEAVYSIQKVAGVR